MYVGMNYRSNGDRASAMASPQLKISTYNVNGITARLPSLLRWLQESRPDIACLQALKSPQERFPETQVREAGYGVAWHGQKSWSGVAILARGNEPIERRPTACHPAMRRGRNQREAP